MLQTRAKSQRSKLANLMILLTLIVISSQRINLNFNIPRINIPNINIPRINNPTITVPSITIPSLNIGSIIPAVTLPASTIPSAPINQAINTVSSLLNGFSGGGITGQLTSIANTLLNLSVVLFSSSCLKQTIPVLSSGWYQLNFDPNALSNRNNPSNLLEDYDFGIQIKNVINSQVIFKQNQNVRTLFSSNGISLPLNRFFLSRPLYNLQLSICGIGIGQWTTSLKLTLRLKDSNNLDCMVQKNQQITSLTSKKICIQCRKGFILNALTGECIPWVQLCAEYKNKLCERCIPDHFVQNNRCFTKTQTCDLFDSVNISCYRCASNYMMIDYKCYEIIKCNDGQFKNEKGECVDGNTTFCKFYQSPSGKCLMCIQQRRFDQQGKCSIVKTPVICPANTQTWRYVLLLGYCLEVDINCVIFLFNGDCPVCRQGFYSFRGQCFKIPAKDKVNQGQIFGQF